MRSLLRFLKYVKPYMKLVVLTFICLVIGLGLELLLPRLLGLVVDRGIAAGNMAVVARLCVILTMAAVGRALLRYGQSYSQERVGQEALRDLRRDLYAKLQRLSFSYYTVHATGDQMSRLTSDLYAVMDFLGFGLSEMISAGIFFTGTMAVLLVIDWHLALALMAPVPLLMFFAFRFSGRIGPLWERIRQEMGNMTTTLQENVSGVRVVKAFAQEPQEIVKFRERNRATLSAHVARAGVEAQTFPLLNVISGVCLLILYWYGGRRVINGQTSLGTYVSFSWYLWGFIWPVRYLGFLIGIARQATAAAPRIFAILDSEMEIGEGADAHEAPPLEGEIHFEDITFAFPDGDGTPVLKHLDLCVHPGETIAILGRTGSGKSSLMQLIPRFYDVDEGRVTIDGIDVRDVTLESLRRQIGIVPQETFLFSDTVRNNVALGDSSADQAEVERVARAAQAHAFISELPDEYETRVGERGIGLSGGQKQRVAIARALLIDPRILLLDEPTSSVDAETEHELQLALEELTEGRTSIVIAQRLSTVKSADRLIVLRDGRVVEEGSHGELLARGGEYTAIYESQFRSQADGGGIGDSIADEDDAVTETKVAEE